MFLRVLWFPYTTDRQERKYVFKPSRQVFKLTSQSPQCLPNKNICPVYKAVQLFKFLMHCYWPKVLQMASEWSQLWVDQSFCQSSLAAHWRKAQFAHSGICITVATFVHVFPFLMYKLHISTTNMNLRHVEDPFELTKTTSSHPGHTKNLKDLSCETNTLI